MLNSSNNYDVKKRILEQNLEGRGGIQLLHPLEWKTSSKSRRTSCSIQCSARREIPKSVKGRELPATHTIVKKKKELK